MAFDWPRSRWAVTAHHRTRAGCATTVSSCNPFGHISSWLLRLVQPSKPITHIRSNPCATPSNLRRLLQPHSSAFSVLRCLVPINRDSRNFGHSMCYILTFRTFFGLAVLQCSTVWTGRILPGTDFASPSTHIRSPKVRHLGNLTLLRSCRSVPRSTLLTDRIYKRPTLWSFQLKFDHIMCVNVAFNFFGPDSDYQSVLEAPLLAVSKKDYLREAFSRVSRGLSHHECNRGILLLLQSHRFVITCLYFNCRNLQC